MGRKRRRQGRQDRLRHEKSSASFNATHPVNPHVSLLCAPGSLLHQPAAAGTTALAMTKLVPP